MSTKSKSSQTQNQSYNNQNTYAYQPGPQSADIDKVRDFQFGIDPSIASTYGGARNKIANSFNNPIGGNYTPQMRDAIMRSSTRDLAQGQAQAHSEAYNASQGARFGQASTVASMTAPRLTQVGSSGTGTSNTSGWSAPSTFDTVGGIAQGVISGAAA